MNPITLFTTLEGRINRKPYWVGWLMMMLAFMVIGFGIVRVWGIEAFNGPYSGASALQLLLGALVTVVSVPLMVKRLHDRNKSGHYVWPLLILEALWVTGDLAGITGNTEDINTLGWCVAAVYSAIAIWMLIELGFLRGTRGDNAYGPDPLGASANATEPAPARS
jgi:uncharacterized membrane protein YhaH (DUF805 family)